MLLSSHTKGIVEAGCDEAGRGCLAGPVYAAAVVLPMDFKNSQLNDSKKLNRKQRNELRQIIEQEALTWAVADVDQREIDEINILNASFLAMHRAIEKLNFIPQALLIDGPRFNAYKDYPYHCIVKGDGKYLSIAAASILAKTYRDDFMKMAHEKYPNYGWDHNMGYPTLEHKKAILNHGLTPLHRKTFNYQLKLEF